MKSRLVRSALVGALLAVATSACAGKSSRSPSPGGSEQPRGNAIVLASNDLASGGSLLDSLHGRVRNMRVERRPGRCPDIRMRGDRTIILATYPLIYVDGNPFSETCILEQIRVNQVERVEIYPSGFTSRPGYKTSPYGLILVFLVGEA
jgi:hypothetical protein